MEIIRLVIPITYIFFSIVESIADAAPVNPNGIETLLGNGVSTSMGKQPSSLDQGILLFDLNPIQ